MTRYLALAAAIGAALAPTHHRPGCSSKLFTVKQAERAVDLTFAGTRDVTAHQRRALDYYTRCQRNPQARPLVRRYRQHAWQAWALRRNPPFNGPSLASWFNDGTTACGTHHWNGFASRDGYCGQQITFRHGTHTVVGVRDDYGPAAWTGRQWDFLPGLKAALGCGDICSVMWR